MSAYSIEKLPGQPIIRLNSYETVAGDQQEDLFQHLYAALEEQPAPVYLLVDSREQTGINLDGIIQSANIAAKGVKSVLHHPNMIELVLLSSSKLAQLAAKGLRSDIFGNVAVQIFETETAAFDYIAAQIKQ